jgi:DNA-binding response OmpR family regulator
MQKILIVDDDASILHGLEEVLKEERFRVVTALTGTKALQLAGSEHPDLIVLDLRLPDMSGEEVCRELRSGKSTIPILMLSSKSGETDKIVGLETGADDYVTKPFSTRELVARIHALLRRTAMQSTEADEVTIGSVHVDLKKNQAKRGKQALRMTAREFDVLRFLIRHEGEVVTREMLLDSVWGYDEFPVTRTVDNYILSIRKKIEPDPAHPRHLLTVHTAGYRFVRKPNV